MARDSSALVNWSQYLGLRALASVLHSFPPEENLRTAKAFGALFCQWNHTRRERAGQNIALSLPELSPEQVDELTRRSMEHMFQLFMVDALVTPRMITHSTWHRHIHLKNIDPILDRLVRGEPMILLTGHCGNWELLGHFFALMGFPLLALARPLDNPLINDWLLGIREARGTRIVTKFGATPILQQTLERGGRLGFIADQNAGDQGLFVPFFGRLASSYKSIGLLAMHYRVPIFAGHARRLNSGLEYEMICVDSIEPAEWEDQPDPLFYITARYNRAMETMIRSAPEQYLWLHRRWKSRPKHERQGKPIPPWLIEKIRGLPWMSEEEAALIIERSNRAAADTARAA